MRFLAAGVFLSLALTAAVTGDARAQWDLDGEPRKPSPLSNLRFYLSVGGFTPVGNLVSASDSTLGGAMSFGIQWGRPKTSRPFTGGIFYEAAGVARSIPSPYPSPFFSSDNTAEAFTIEGGGLDGMFYLSPGKTARLYVGGGVGLFQVKRKIVSSDDGLFAVFSNDELESSYRITPGFRGMVGVEIGRGFFAEGRYLNAGTMDGIRFQGFSLSAGYRY